MFFHSVFARVANLTLLLSAIFDVSYSHAVLLPRATTECNGYAQLCNRSYGNITFVGAHDSYGIGSINQLTANQDQNVTRQLNDGIRMLQMQAHWQNNEIYLCHTSCDLENGGTLLSYLMTVQSWLSTNPNEVLTLLIVNSDDLFASQYDTVFKAAGLDTISYANWPTLGSMINAGTRLVTFLDNGGGNATVDVELSQIWETAFDVTSATFDCNVNRTSGDSATQMYLINHFLDSLLLGQFVPDTAQLNADTCIAQQGRAPNFMLVDFYEFGGGSVFEVAATLNGVSYNPTTPVATPAPTSSTTGTSSSAASILRPSEGLAITLLMILSSIICVWTTF
ncbi:PLC-like phosphodiesterase [Amanita rubescens]|nr:PLC-like phosphodiesterase [Amanita rubescens]